MLFVISYFVTLTYVVTVDALLVMPFIQAIGILLPCRIGALVFFLSFSYKKLSILVSRTKFTVVLEIKV